MISRTRTLVLPAHAKLNLDLSVVGVRDDGFHEIRTRFQAISLHDLLMAERAATTMLEGGYEDDLVLRAQRALEAAVGRSLPARLTLVKRIPAGAGLGGGSSDAAAALRALAGLYGIDADLRPVAAGLGADVRFFLSGGTVIAGGRGDALEPAPQEAGWFAVAWPGCPISTAEVYRTWDRVGGDGANHLTRAAMLVQPGLPQFAAMLGDGWRMTGSGSAFFKPCRSRAEAERAISTLGCWTAVTRAVGSWGDV